VIAEKYYEPPLVNVISFACNACPETSVFVTNNCQGCLAHPCTAVCPVKATSIVNGHSVIDSTKCLKCGRCADACPYSAIVKRKRPCASACGMDAIGSDNLGRAKIDYDKCVSCGQCLVSCPFGAIADKSQIFQLIQAIKQGEVIAEIAPAFVGQFGPSATPEKMKEALKKLGFTEVYETAIGADLCTVEEARDFLEKVPEKQPFMGTSCCPAWSVMAKKLFPEYAHCISMTMTPMVWTARWIKKHHPNAKIVFIGPCAAKKLEASRRTVRSDVDFVITFEELMGMFVAKGVEFDEVELDDPLEDASTVGRNFAVAGGVAEAVVDCIKKQYPDKNVLVESAAGLKDCRKMMTLAKAGKRNGYLLEGMACPGGCVAGAGTLLPITRASTAVKSFAKTAAIGHAADNKYVEELEHLSDV